MAKDKDLETKKSAKNSSKDTNSAKKQEKEKKPGKITKFFKDLKSEVKKVVWPSKQQVFNNTLVVLATMAVMALFVGGIDYGLSALLNLLLKNA